MSLRSRRRTVFNRRLAVESLEDRRLLTGFTPGNLVVYRVGDGSAPLNTPFQRAQPVFLVEVDPVSGSFGPLVLPMPTAVDGAQRRLTATGFESEGLMTRSVDGQYLVLGGYDQPVGASPTSGAAAADIPRVIGRVDATGNIDTSTIITGSTFDSREIRGVASLDGSRFWVTNSGTGIHVVNYQSTGESVQIATAPAGGRAIHIFDGQLYVGMTTSPDTNRLASVGSGLPTTAGQTLTFLPGFPTLLTEAIQPFQFFMADLSPSVPGDDTLYVADGTKGLRKFSLLAPGGDWTANGLVLAGAGLRGLVGEVNGNSVSIFAVTSEIHDNRIVRFIDTAGHNGGISGNMVQMQSAGGNRAFRGVAFAPIEIEPPPPPPPADLDAVVEAGSGDNAIVVALVADNVVVSVDGSEALNHPLDKLSSLTIDAGDGDDTLTLHDSLGSELIAPITLLGGSGQNTLVVAGAGGGSLVTITESFIEGLTGNTAGSDVTYHDIDVLEVTGTEADDVFDLKLDGGCDLDFLTVHGGDGNDQFLLDLNTDPTDADNAVPGLVRVVLSGGRGGDVFGQSGVGLVGKIQPSTTTAIVIEGGDAASLTALVPAGNATAGNEVGAGFDAVRLDLTDRRPPALSDAAVAIVSTVGGMANVTGFQPIEFRGVEAIELGDQDVLTGVEMGDLYVRGTQGSDVIQFAAASTPQVARTRINAFGAYLEVTRKTVVYGRGGNDTIVQGNLNLPAEFHGDGGDDYLAGYQADDLLVGGLGNDRVYGGNGDNELWGDNLDEQDLPIGGNDSLYGGAGEDVVYGGGGHDQVIAGLGDDYVFGGHGNDLVSGGGGGDRLYGGEGNDTLGGDDGNDVLAGGEGDDRLYGRGGDDLLIGGFGADLLSGEAGSDLLIAGRVSTGLGGGGSEASRAAHDAHDQAMRALLADWTLDQQLALALSFLHDDDKDSLSGGTGVDAAAAGATDVGDWEQLL